jgi:hypothetical protein
MDIIDIGLWLGYLLLIVAAGSAIVLPLLNAIKTPGTFVRSLYGVGALVVVFVIAYAVSGSDVTQNQAALGVTENSSRMIGAGLIMFYITLVVAVVGIVYSEISKAFK